MMRPAGWMRANHAVLGCCFVEQGERHVLATAGGSGDVMLYDVLQGTLVHLMCLEIRNQKLWTL